MREKGEAALLSGQKLFERDEVKADKVAHTEFLRVAKLMSAIGKNDALYSSGLNTYCLLYSEISEMEKEKRALSLLVAEIAEKVENICDPEEIVEVTKALTKLVAQKVSLGKAIDSKRNMMLAIDKENVMTVSAALRSIPKQPEKTVNPLIAALQGGDDDDID